MLSEKDVGWKQSLIGYQLHGNFASLMHLSLEATIFDCFCASSLPMFLKKCAALIDNLVSLVDHDILLQMLRNGAWDQYMSALESPVKEKLSKYQV
uniref:Uncharacterized protein LOC103444905 isoform X1 n=1 Tax=Rhizophora mucronata TaxID=61149 RepID=A0A2P2MHL4_RHIMU